MVIRRETRQRAAHLRRAMKLGLSPLWAGIGAVTAIVGGSVLIGVVWGVKHLFWGVVLLLVITLLVFIEGSYKLSRRLETVHSAALGDALEERDAVQREIDRRLSRLRHALQCIEVEHVVRLRSGDRTYGDAEVRLSLQNRSETDDVRWEMESVAAVVDGLHSTDDPPAPSGSVLVARDCVFVRCPLVRDVPLQPQSGWVTFTVMYGHAEGPLQFQKTQAYQLNATTGRWGLVSNSEVEDI